MAFERPIAPRKSYSCKDSRFVLLETFGKRLELWQRALFYRAEPGLQLVSRMLSDHVHERLCQAVSSLRAWTGLSNQRQFFLLCLIQIIQLTYKQPRGPLCREVLQRYSRLGTASPPSPFRSRSLASFSVMFPYCPYILD